MRVRLSAELDPKAKRERPALEKGATHEKALRQNPHGLLADLDLGADPGCRGGVLVQPQMHRFSSSMTSRAKSKPRRRPVNESSETRQLASERIQRENRKAQQERRMEDWISEGELWSAGLAMVWKLLRVLLK